MKKVILAILLTALVCGGGAYFYIENFVKDSNEPSGDIQDDQKENDNNDDVTGKEEITLEPLKPLSKPNTDSLDEYYKSLDYRLNEDTPEVCYEEYYDNMKCYSDSTFMIDRVFKNYTIIDNFEILVNNKTHQITVLYNYQLGNYELAPTRVAYITRTIFYDNKEISILERVGISGLEISETDEPKKVYNNIIKFLNVDLESENIRITRDYFKKIKGTDGKEYVGLDSGDNMKTLILLNENGQKIENDINFAFYGAEFGQRDENDNIIIDDLSTSWHLYDDYFEASYFKTQKETMDFYESKITIANDKLNIEVIKKYENIEVLSGGIK